MNVTVELMNASAETDIPSQQHFTRWAATALDSLPGRPATERKRLEVCIRLVDETESAELNARYRQKQGATNILSFPYPDSGIEEFNLLGDLAICAPLVRKEAREQAKKLDAHWAHLTVHGILHLNGYDHEAGAAAREMEALEIDIMKTLGFDNPYRHD